MPNTQTVPTGPYFGFTLAELNLELLRYKAARKTSFTRLVGSSVNGNSYSFGDRTDGSLDEWQAALQAALNYISPGQYFSPPTDRSAARINNQVGYLSGGF